MKIEYIRNKKIYSFSEKLSEEDYIKFYNGELSGHYEGEYVAVDMLPELKQQVIDKIDVFIQEKIFKGFNFDGKLFSMSVNAQINWSNILNIPNELFPLNVSTKNDENYSLSLANKTSFYYVYLNYKYSCLNQGNVLKNNLNLLTTEEEVLAFEIA